MEYLPAGNDCRNLRVIKTKRKNIRIKKYLTRSVIYGMWNSHTESFLSRSAKALLLCTLTSAIEQPTISTYIKYSHIQNLLYNYYYLSFLLLPISQIKSNNIRHGGRNYFHENKSPENVCIHKLTSIRTLT